MSDIRAKWGSHDDTSIAASSITNGSSALTAAIDSNGKSFVEIGVTVAYGGTANKGATIYICRQVDASNYEDEVDNPHGVEMAFAVSATRRKPITVDCRLISSFKVMVKNDTGATITATVVTREGVDEAV